MSVGVDLEPRSAELPKIRGGKGGGEKEKEFRTLGARGVQQLPQGNAMMGTATAAARGSSPNAMAGTSSRCWWMPTSAKGRYGSYNLAAGGGSVRGESRQHRQLRWDAAHELVGVEIPARCGRHIVRRGDLEQHHPLQDPLPIATLRLLAWSAISACLPHSDCKSPARTPSQRRPAPPRTCLPSILWHRLGSTA